MGHKNPDMDSFGAAVGLWSAIRQLGKSCNIIIDNDINAIDYYINKLKCDNKYDNLLISSSVAEKAINDKTLLIIVDVHNKGYVNNLSIVEKINSLNACEITLALTLVLFSSSRVFHKR